MTKVDAKGRIVLPRDVRERLGIAPGTEVEIREEDGKAIVEPEDDPEQVIERMEQLISEASDNRNSVTTSHEELHPIAQKHADSIRRGAQQTDSDDE